MTERQSNHRPTTSVRPPAVIGPRLVRLLPIVFVLFALEAVNAVYLVAVRVAGWATGVNFENRLSLIVFLVHLILGLAIILPGLLFAVFHLRRARRWPNRRAVQVGFGLLSVVVMLMISGLVLIRIEGVMVVKNPLFRDIAYWIHLASPVAAVWLFVLHRLAGRPIRWRVGRKWALVACGLTAALLIGSMIDLRRRERIVVPDGEGPFSPSLAQTADGRFIPGHVLDNDDYCQRCHGDVHERWASSVHRFSSFNNPPYRFSVRNTRTKVLERDGTERASRFCAGCHDPVPLFSGRFDDPEFDDETDPTALSGVTCTVCHSITEINSPRGNADYTIEEPVHYPFAFSESTALQWLNQQLVLAKPEMHKRTFLKPLHQSTEFCGTCHKVHLPEGLNHYKWLRGQNHYDSFLLSGVSGRGVSSFYYPPKAQPNCNGCHMPLQPSDDFGARRFDDSGMLTVHDHLFPAANTAMPVLAEVPNPEATIAAHRAFLQDIVRLDLFGVREGGTIDGTLVAPLRPEVPALVPGRTYLLETVIRTTGLGHLLTEGTADSNQLWLDLTLTADGRTIGRSGSLDDAGRVDPWSHFVNAYVLDREGNRIDRRNAEDIFVPLYSNQIPPGAADVVHYRFEVPPGIRGPVVAEVALRYRKFDTVYLRHIDGEDVVNDLPITTMAADRVVFGIAGGVENPPSAIPEWQRYNDYGIGLFRKGGRGELRQAEEIFRQVEALGRSEGSLNLARVYLREGRVAAEAPAALARAAGFDPPAPVWSVLWFSGQVNRQNGRFDEAIRDFRQIVDGGFAEAAGRGFDFSRDYRLLNALAGTLYQRGLQERGEGRREERRRWLDEARVWYEAALEEDPENLAAHWGLKQVLADLGDSAGAAHHAAQHARYRPDDNARDVAMTAARRRDPAADHAAEAVVVYEVSTPAEAS